MNCKDCDRPLTTYQSINPKYGPEIFCEYCEANPPVYESVTTLGDMVSKPDIVQDGSWQVGTPFPLGPEHRQQSEDRMIRSKAVGNQFYYVDHTGKATEPSDNFAARVAEKIYKDLNKPWRETPPVYLSLHVGEPERGNEIGDLIYPGNRQWYSRRPTTLSTPRVGACFNERLATWEPDTGWWITHFGVYDAKTGGNLLFHAPLGRVIQTRAGDSFEFQPGAVKMQVT